MNRFYLRVCLTVALACAGVWAFDVEVHAQARSRPLAAGILTTIPPTPVAEETFSGPLPLVEIPANIPDLEYTPNLAPKSATVFERAKTVTLRRGIWNLELSFKPMRLLPVDVPQPTG
jgi:hypothetical protein